MSDDNADDHADSSGTTGERIELVGLTKRYPGQAEPAVENVDLDVAAGELVVFVGPSGCGKTTTMKMINRLIEPTSGSIRIDGRDVLAMQPDQLRRHIGYVIQQIGLFPHMTIAQNIGIVPNLLKWPKKKVAERVDHLLHLVGLDPTVHARRYPRQLSGGQQQRIGVARALAADPPVMLMDEPFGATDPITRLRLQDEFLRLQRELRKTIIFVTHDFEEAIKLGDRIAVLRERSHIAQYDTPANILARPADEYVASFVGGDATLKRLALHTVGEIDGEPGAPADLPGVAPTATLREALDVMVARGSDRISVDGTVVTFAQLSAAVRAADAVDRQQTTAGH
ncbi:betaine/proline/choline family ABC transporter ATP-binding protein [Planosporangium thailandense]|uniref:Betaine/proline/choline family ABC transporter ATP-binding protein n=1 Tax=Planosporangium thailandense TaxID=765197 RepID=A0ABX0Y7Z5_9ACTN|nr:betaine/proline/choline family ABC transporter ATP-binding protein [Planosporangium thailandense]